MIDQESHNCFRYWVIHVLFYHIEIWCDESFDHLCFSLLPQLCIISHLDYGRHTGQTISRQSVVLRKWCVKCVELISFGGICRTLSRLFLNHFHFFLVISLVQGFKFAVHDLRLVHDSLFHICLFFIESENALRCRLGLVWLASLLLTIETEI